MTGGRDWRADLLMCCVHAACVWLAAAWRAMAALARRLQRICMLLARLSLSESSETLCELLAGASGAAAHALGTDSP